MSLDFNVFYIIQKLSLSVNYNWVHIYQYAKRIVIPNVIKQGWYQQSKFFYWSLGDWYHRIVLFWLKILFEIKFIVSYRSEFVSRAFQWNKNHLKSTTVRIKQVSTVESHCKLGETKLPIYVIILGLKMVNFRLRKTI